MENDFSDDADEMRWHIKDLEKGAFHTQKLSGSVTLESISPSTTILKSNYSYSSEIKTEKTFLTTFSQ